MSSSNNNTLYNGLTYDQNIQDNIYYHTLESIPLPLSTTSPLGTFTYNGQEYVNTSQYTAETQLDSEWSSIAEQSNQQYTTVLAPQIGNESFTEPTLSTAGFLNQFQGYNLPSSWANFVANLQNYTKPQLPAGKSIPTNGTQPTPAITAAQLTAIQNQFVSDYEYALRFPTTEPSQTPGTDGGTSEWTDVILGLSKDPTIATAAAAAGESAFTYAYNQLSASMTSQFQNAFTTFLRNYPYTSITQTSTVNGQTVTTDTGTQTPITPADFFTNWSKFLTADASLNPATFSIAATSTAPNGTATQSGGLALQSYLGLFQSYFPAPPAGGTNVFGQTQSEYDTYYQGLLDTFINQEMPTVNGDTFSQQLTTSPASSITTAGFFNPSRSFSDWATFLQTSYQQISGGLSVPALNVSSLEDKQSNTYFAALSTSTNLTTFLSANYPGWSGLSTTQQQSILTSFGQNINTIPANNLTQDQVNAIQYAFSNPAPSNSNIVNLASYLNQQATANGDDFASELSKLVNGLPQTLSSTEKGLLQGIGISISTSTSLSQTQLQLIAQAAANPTDPTIPAAYVNLANYLTQKASTNNESFGTALANLNTGVQFTSSTSSTNLPTLLSSIGISYAAGSTLSSTQISDLQYAYNYQNVTQSSPAIQAVAKYLNQLASSNPTESFSDLIDKFLNDPSAGQLAPAALTLLQNLGDIGNPPLVVTASQLQQIQNAYANPSAAAASTDPGTIAAATLAAFVKQISTQTVLTQLANDPSSLFTGSIAGSAGTGQGGGSSVNNDPGRKLTVLNDIFALIIEMINTLQNIAAAQSQRLTLLSTWEQQYVNLQNQIHTFYKGNGDFVDGSGGTGTITTGFYDKMTDSAGSSDPSLPNQVRDNLNNTVNANLSQILQNNRGVIDNDAKALQSTVSTTSDAVTQQENIASSILQQLETILNAIFPN